MKAVCNKCGASISFLRMYVYMLGNPNKTKCKNCEKFIFDRQHRVIDYLYFMIFWILTIVIVTTFNDGFSLWNHILSIVLIFMLLVILTAPLYFKFMLWHEKRHSRKVNEDDENEDNSKIL